MSVYKFGKGIPTWNGVPMVGGMPITEGNYFFVDADNGSDGNKGISIDRPFATVAKAYASATTNNNDVICLIGSGTHTLTEMLDVSKNRVHFVGLDGTNRRYGQGAKVTIGVTTAVTDIAAMQNTGVRNSFTNIKFSSNNTLTEGKYAVVEAGEYAKYDSCEFYLSTQLGVTGAAELACNGDSAQFSGCTFGSTANALTGTVVRPCVILTKALVTGKVSRDVTFEDCQFWRWAAHANNAFVWATTATDVERKMEFKDCLFYADKKSTGTPAVAVGGAAALTVGRIIITGLSAEIGCTALATQTGVWAAMPAYDAGGGSGIQAT
jgi:hypothetical protein